jgi:DNA-binding GntR family transcriptional regulator
VSREREETISEAFSGSLARVRQAVSDLEDAAGLPVESNTGWGEAIIAAAEVEYAAGELRRAVDQRAPSRV